MTTEAQMVTLYNERRVREERRRETAIANRYAHSILDVCQLLHGDVKGTGSPLDPGRMYALTTWLNDRVELAWVDSPEPRGTDDKEVIRLADQRRYDLAVRELARATQRLVTGSRSWVDAIDWQREEIAAGRA